MAVNLTEPAVLYPVDGVRVGVAQAAVKRPGRDDLALISLAPGSVVAGVFTRNAFAAAPVVLCRRFLASGADIRAILINSGNANAATGQAGIEDATALCAAVAGQLGCAVDQVLPLSTGVIGQRLPVDRMRVAIPHAFSALQEDGWLRGMRAIMTTDTVGKGATRRFRLGGGEATVTGIAKGVGMIHPDMATLLAVIATDVKLTPEAVRIALGDAVGRTFNCVTVDGDTSTNDTCLLAATGSRGGAPIDVMHPDFKTFCEALHGVCLELAHAIVRDGEGATKFIEVAVAGAQTPAEARQVALSIAHSPLVKTALFAGDANWGRLVMAIGKSGVSGLDPAKISLALDDVPLLAKGEPHPSYREEQGAAVVGRPEFAIRVDLGRGTATTTVWTCDFSYDYVKINAEYRT